jgi:hypothetical protein
MSDSAYHRKVTVSGPLKIETLKLALKNVQYDDIEDYQLA